MTISGEESANKSKAIRDYKLAHRRAKPSTIADALRAQGIQVGATYVSNILHNARKKSGRRPRTAQPEETAAVAAAPVAPPLAADAVSVAALKKAKKLAEEMGGIDAARAALSALSKLMD